ncbi:hypothetical protein GIB67_008185, partial [Kingdonia uniflora]
MNILIEAYCKGSMLQKAKELKSKAQSKRAKANVKTWEIFMEYHLKNGDMNLAMDCIAKAILTGEKDARKKYANAGKMSPSMRHMLKMENVEVNVAAEKLLK